MIYIHKKEVVIFFSKVSLKLGLSQKRGVMCEYDSPVSTDSKDSAVQITAGKQLNAHTNGGYCTPYLLHLT